ncbi:MAG: FAD:protein FMN transferase [Lachnospiraceae bacterium]
MKKRFLLWAATIAAVLLCSGCGKKEVNPVSKQEFLLDTFVSVTLYDTEDQTILDGAMELCRDYENLLSKTIETSEVYAMNHRGDQTSMEVSPETAQLLEKALYYSELSGGAFDVTIEPLSSLWDFTGDSNEIPSEAVLEEQAAKVDYHNMKVEGNTVTFLSPDTTVELGAIAKGFIADKMKEYLISQGVESAIINLGGNVLCIGEKPGGQPFKVGLQKPFEERNETAAIMDIRDMSVVSSGVYERHFVVDGVNYHHILDPKTGYPYQNGLTGVTIISPMSVDGDGLSTVCFSLGLEKGLELLNSLDGIYGAFITEDGEIHYSQGAEELLDAKSQ